MTREWKVGEVAFYARYPYAGPLFKTEDGWVDTEGDARSPIAEHLRPLAVIDPEDGEQVKRLYDLYYRNLPGSGLDQMADALREFTDPKPPKPEEPTGLGAVVEDASGDYYVYGGLRDDDDRRWWIHAANRKKYRDIDVVRVLSEGVQA